MQLLRNDKRQGVLNERIDVNLKNPTSQSLISVTVDNQNQIAVVIASANRPDMLITTIKSVLNQSRLPDEVIVSVPSEADFPRDGFPSFVRRICSNQGLTIQRNAGIKALTSKPLFVAFLDDDLILHRDYLQNMERMFVARPNAVLIMGHLVANGNISLEQAKALVESPPDCGPDTDQYYPSQLEYGGVYGANMCIRYSLLEKERFDERLALYSMMEDVDMGTRARQYGEVGYYFGSMAAHLRVAGGRISQRALGYSEVMNPVYLSIKGTIPKTHAILHAVLRNPVANTIWAFLPHKRRSDRWQRLIGNLFALWHIMSFRIEPERVIEIDQD